MMAGAIIQVVHRSQAPPQRHGRGGNSWVAALRQLLPAVYRVQDAFHNTLRTVRPTDEYVIS